MMLKGILRKLMKYNFNQIVNRVGLNSYKYQDKENYLPMWIADMDFDTPDFIKNALINRIEKGSYGYDYLGEEYYQSIIDWYKSVHQILISKNDILFSVGVIPSIASIIRSLTNKNDNICILTPTYPMFYKTIEINQRNPIYCSLKYQNNLYEIDFELLEECLKQSKLFILCQPHNPIGKIYQLDEIEKIVQLCKQYDVYLISDEIHSDLSYETFYSLLLCQYDKCIVLSAPTKTFNLAGLKTSFAIVGNQKLREQIQKQFKIDCIQDVNTFASIGSTVAFNKGKEYLEELKKYLLNNFQTLLEIEKQVDVKVIQLQATYLAWIDISHYVKDTKHFVNYLRKQYQLHLSSGHDFLESDGHFVRLNFATSNELVKEAAKRLSQALLNYVAA